jgi:integrase
MPRAKIEFQKSDLATTEWIKSLTGSTLKSYSTYWRDFLEFTELNGDQILQSKKVDMKYVWEQKILDFNTWLMKDRKGQRALASGTARAAANAVRGFFTYHRQTLQFRRSEKTKLSEYKPVFEDYRFSREDLKKMCDFANLPEKYIITAGKSFGLRAGDFLMLTRGYFDPYIDRPVPISIGAFRTHKENTDAYPFIDSDAAPIIKLMLEKMTREDRTSPKERMLTYSDEIQLSRTLRKVADKAGIQHGDKRIRFHNLRKFLSDRLSSHMSESKWKQIVGKKISEGAYVSPDSLREDYSRAMKETTFAVSDLLELQRRQQVVEAIQSKINTGEPLNEEDRVNMKRYGMRARARKVSCCY